MNPAHAAATAATDRGRSRFPLGFVAGAFALLALAVVPAACGGSGAHEQMGSGGGTGSGGKSMGTGGGAGAGVAGAVGATGGVSGSGGAGAAGSSGGGGAGAGGGASGGAAGAGASGGAAGGAAGSSAGGGAGTGTGGFAGAGGRGTGGAGAGGAGGNSVCASAVANAPCSTENASCGGGACTDICKPCQLLICRSGRWQSNESAGVQCFSCGPTLLCEIRKAYCRTTSGGAAETPPSYACVDLPSVCLDAPTCACLSREHVAGSCSQDERGALMTRLLVP
jgi:hypothetical protein